MPAHLGRWGSFWEQRARQLQRQVQAGAARIVQVQTESAALHLRLAWLQGRAWRGSQASEPHEGPREAGQQGRRWRDAHLAVGQLQAELQALRRCVKELTRSWGVQLQACVSAVTAHVQGLRSPEEFGGWPSRVAELEQQLQETSLRWERERRERRRLHNCLVELRGSIRVHCRIRPLLPRDLEGGDPATRNSTAVGEAVFAVDDETVLVKCGSPGRPEIRKVFRFERVYGPEEPQSAVFQDVRPLLTSFLDGYDVCVLLYGPTGSGKSYSLAGPSGSPPQHSGAPGQRAGLLPRVAHELFRLLSDEPAGGRTLALSVLEVYNERTVDLLGLGAGPGARHERSPLHFQCVASAEELLSLVGTGLRLRAQRATRVHPQSSRSHLVVTVSLTRDASGDRTGQPPGGATGPGAAVHPTLQLVDLAGSECAGVSGVAGSALRETGSINRSLAALGDVLAAWAERRPHIPYRNSTLTRLLQGALGGDAKLLLLLCLSPCARHLAETLQSLGFGARARRVQRGPPKCSPWSTRSSGEGEGVWGAAGCAHGEHAMQTPE